MTADKDASVKCLERGDGGLCHVNPLLGQLVHPACLADWVETVDLTHRMAEMGVTRSATFFDLRRALAVELRGIDAE